MELCAALRSGERRGGEVERQQAREDGDLFQVMRPAIGVEHGAVEPLVSLLKPRRPLVVQVGECALGRWLAARVRAIEPVVAIKHQLTRRQGDCLHARIALWTPYYPMRALYSIGESRLCSSRIIDSQSQNISNKQICLN